MEAIQGRGLKFFRRTGLFAVLLALLLPATASAADSIYWSREDGFNSIRVGNLDGSVSPTSPKTLFDDPGRPCGVALNPAGGKIYWANWDSGQIQVANLDGTPLHTNPDVFIDTLFTAPGNNLCGVAVDPANNKIYWANFSTSEIWVGNLDGTGTASILFTDPPGSGPSGVAIDPAGGKIYWTNQPTDQVRVGNLNGSGSASTLFGSDALVPSAEDNPIGVAVDPAAGKIYWTDLAAGAVRVGPLGGSTVGTATTLFNVTTFGPSGPAIDPTASPPKIYWAGWQSGAGIQSGNLDPIGGPTPLFSGEGNSLFTAVLKAPAPADPAEPPEISEGFGGQLTCSQGSWAPDLLGAFLYRAPAEFDFQWQKVGDGDIPGEMASTFMPTDPGDYTCTVTATNQAGSASQTSVAFNVPAPEITELSPAHGWIGLKNSDDQGTQFDLRAELLKNGEVVASGLKRCITGVTRNPALATEAVVPWDAFAPVSTSPGDTLSLRFSTRIGTNPNNPNNSKCAGPGGSHSSAVGLRLYYDSATRPSAFDAKIAPDPSQALYLRSDGNACANQESTSVTSRFLHSTSPSAANAKCKDSAAVKFAGGNAFKDIGTWSLAPLP